MNESISSPPELTVIGKSPNRVDGRAKITGRANYAADNQLDGLVHAVGVFSAIGSGTITAIDTTAAGKAPGVIKILHHQNISKLHRSPNQMAAGNKVGEVRPPLEDDVVYYAGQFVALVIAETFEQARTAARLVQVSISEKPPMLSLEEGVAAKRDRPKDGDSSRGTPDEAFAAAAVKIDATYTTPVEVHNPMELHASVAVWHGDKLETHESTQWVVGQRKALAVILGIDPENVTVHAPYIGGGFGGKLFLWPHTVLAAIAAREVKRPVKLVVERKNMFTTVGHRPATLQRVRLGATPDGLLAAMRHDSHSHTSLVDDYVEHCGETTASLYRCPDVAVTQRIVPINVGTPTSMRAPGAAPGLFALESAMDELAVALQIDPLEFRLKNISGRDDGENLPWSSNHLRECFDTATQRFGWKRRTPAPGSMRDGNEILGWGLAAASWHSPRRGCNARVQLRSDGTARVTCATQDIGTGTYTVIAQVAAEVLGLPLEKIEVAIGNSDFPEGPISGGSMVTATVVPAIAQASRQAIEEILKTASAPGNRFAGAAPGSLSWQKGVIANQAGDRRATATDVLAAARIRSVEGEAKTTPGDDLKKYSFRSWGAHCVEVRWDPEIFRLRVSRIASAFDVGRVINQKTARNQIYGSLVMGMGMALFEESIHDERTGRVVTDNIADYIMPVAADLPEIEIALLDHPDPYIGEFGAKGVGEIGITGVAAAIANAIYHATGKRVRDLPIRIEKLMG